jgi:hypothetical protein
MLTNFCEQTVTKAFKWELTVYKSSTFYVILWFIVYLFVNFLLHLYSS